MGFQPEVNERLVINGSMYIVGEHPNAPGVPYGQEGRQGTVYLLYSEEREHKKAIKVFRSKFINPSMAFQTEQIAKYKGMSGLSACERFIITPQNNTQLLSNESDLLYAVVMNWVEGPTWMDILLNKQCLTKKQSYSAAYALAYTLVAMEQRGLSHCDLSAPNLILPMFDKSKKDIKPIDYVQLIDLEQMYAAHLERPEYVPAGSPGYAPQNSSQNKTQSGLWSASSDRFAGAVLFMEMLAACTELFFENTWGESYFAPSELQTDCVRYNKLVQAIRTNWGDAIASLFERAWDSDDLNQCPTFGEWMLEISKMEYAIYEQPQVAAANEQVKPKEAASQPNDGKKVEALLARARQLESRGKFKDAIEVYRSIHLQNPHSSLAREIDVAIEILEEKKGDRKKRLRALFSKRPSLKVSNKTVWLSVLVVVIALGGYSAYTFFKDPAHRVSVSSAFAFLSASSPEKKITLEEAKAQIESLTNEVKEKDKTITQLSTQVKELNKPMVKRREDLIDQLNNDFNEIRKIAASNSSATAELDKKTFAASTNYMNHLLEFIKISFNLNQQFVDQANVVQGYHYPYIYNENRNSQLNIQFYKDYKGKFTN